MIARTLTGLCVSTALLCAQEEEPTVRVDVLSNGGFERAGGAAPVPFWRAVSGSPSIGEKDGRRALRTAYVRGVPDTAAQRIPLVPGLATRLEVRGAMRGWAVLTLNDARGATLSQAFPAPRWLDSTVTGAMLCDALGRAPTPPLMLMLTPELAQGHGAEAYFDDFVAEVELPCPGEASLAEEVSARLEHALAALGEGPFPRELAPVLGRFDEGVVERVVARWLSDGQLHALLDYVETGGEVELATLERVRGAAPGQGAIAALESLAHRSRLLKPAPEGTWARLGFDEERFGGLWPAAHDPPRLAAVGEQAVALVRADPEAEMYRRFLREGAERGLTALDAALLAGAPLEPDGTRGWRVLVEAAALEPELAPRVRGVLWDAILARFRGQQIAGGAWRDLRIEEHLPVGEGAAPGALLLGLATAYDAGVGLRTDALRGIVTAVLRSCPDDDPSLVAGLAELLAELER